MADQTDDRGVPTRAVASGEPAPTVEAELGRSLNNQPATIIAALLQETAKPAHNSVSSKATDLPGAGSEAAHVAALSSKAEPEFGDKKVDARTLIVGPGVSFSGDLSSCDHLVVEGRVEANVDGCQNMMIAETGVFRGNGSTENADVRGRIDREFQARKRLLIRDSGHVSGTITYGEIEIEAGGKISGTIQAP